MILANNWCIPCGLSLEGPADCFQFSKSDVVNGTRTKTGFPNDPTACLNRVWITGLPCLGWQAIGLKFMLLLFESVDSFRGDNTTPEPGEASCTSLAGLTGKLPCPGDRRGTEPSLASPTEPTKEGLQVTSLVLPHHGIYVGD